MEDEIPDFDGRVDLCVMDVSFISQTCILPALSDIVREGGGLVSLIKPQFELGAGALGKGGVVRRAADREAAVRRVLASADACGFSAVGVITSPIEGGDGNVEYVGYFRRVSRS
jgi:23S rRNA (cytidine1920-2'-O)/16S rRNA (cytidine1409-2'-O)-methyltransferase